MKTYREVEDQTVNQRVLMMSSVPLASPWNGADKNLARLLVQYDSENQYTIETGAEDAWLAHVTPIRSKCPNPMPTRAQKVRAFGYLVRYSWGADLVHIVSSLSNPSRLGMKVLRGWKAAARKPVIHTLPSIGDLPVQRDHFIGDITVVVSEYSRGRLLSEGIPNVLRVYPPLDPQRLTPKIEPAKLAQELSLGNQAVLYPAHYGPKSGIREMILAFAQLPAEYHDAVLVLACRTQPQQDGRKEEQLTRAIAESSGISDRVRILGNIHDMPALITACAFTALVPGSLASKMDLPMVVLESLALNRPVLISDRPPMDEALLGDGGFKVRYGDIGELTDALLRLLSNPELRTTLGTLGCSAVLEHCSPSGVIDQYRQIYRSATKSHNLLAEKAV